MSCKISIRIRKKILVKSTWVCQYIILDEYFNLANSSDSCLLIFQLLIPFSEIRNDVNQFT